MADSVVPMRPGIEPAGLPVQSVIDVLEKALEQAKRGEIIAVGIAEITAAGKAGTFARGGSGTRFSLLGAVACLSHDIIKDWGD